MINFPTRLLQFVIRLWNFNTVIEIGYRYRQMHEGYGPECYVKDIMPYYYKGIWYPNINYIKLRTYRIWNIKLLIESFTQDNRRVENDY